MNIITTMILKENKIKKPQPAQYSLQEGRYGCQTCLHSGFESGQFRAVYGDESEF